MTEKAKLTFKEFKRKITSEGYKNRTGARRALGKVLNFTDAEVEKARELIDQHLPPTKLKPKKKSGKQPELAYVITVVTEFLQLPWQTKSAILKILEGAEANNMSLPVLHHTLKSAIDKLRMK
jgi:hypothetical protein